VVPSRFQGIPARLAGKAAMACACCLFLPAIAISKPSIETMKLPEDVVTPDTQVIPVNLFGDPRKEIVTVKHDEVQIWGYTKDQLAPLQDFRLPTPAGAAGKTYYTFAQLDHTPYLRLVLLMPDGIFYYKPDTDHLDIQPVRILSKQLIQGDVAGKSIQYFNFALDLNGDGLDELLLPEQNGFSIYRQTAPLQFSSVELPKSPYKQTDIFSFHKALSDDPSRVSAISTSIIHRRGVENLLIYDANGDGLQDLIYMSTAPGPESRQNDRYEVYLQHKNGTFDSQPSQTMDVPYESNSDITFRDINGDHKLDAFVVRSNFDLLNPKTVVKLYVAKSSRQTFTQETDRFVTKDPIGVVRIADFNNDNLPDFAMTFFSYQFGSTEDIVDFVMSSKLQFKLQFYLGRGSRGYNRRPDYEKELTVNMKAESYGGYPPVYITGDLNGDGFMDLIVRSAEDELSVYPSEGGISFPRDPVAQIAIPEDGFVDFEDVDGDGNRDIIVSSGSRHVFAVHFLRTK
jgi:hypothetical protein